MSYFDEFDYLNEDNYEPVPRYPRCTCKSSQDGAPCNYCDRDPVETEAPKDQDSEPAEEEADQ